MIRSVVSILFCVAGFLAAISSSHSATNEESLLRAAMQINRSNDGRELDSGVAIRAYINNGLLRRKPEDRTDYVDTRVLGKPAYLFGQRLVIIQEEYMDRYIGCCVDPGINVIVEQQGNADELQSFAVLNKCRISANDTEGMESVGLRPETGKSYLKVSCHLRELAGE